ncbi:C26 family cysteine hydrolase domain-containing family [Candidatus Woesearchaeota archaeon]|jgi:GMP synthase (glutamine-hydrolysing)|nr:C26 family cysteine hydrolase domain-containing family [Candidatus Woesearchaeota archaeon]MBT5397297.1 C26 family cysteine hydrolase domain-containing family [Candidatus Woesearchaeota archaeon]MBT5924278.1 C26 family cysteine hydrolase domain-containing family [Candidatus Woesearchaeota archaeon]MBT6367858.1 C26 family cysteine hydrolase domain-containing family [Candidatus Woesearchaeota archaeon]MBT7762697.1 C26 family cysteine hydrolase domain-containing family [Candidatus Woesearchaeot
MQTNNNNKIVLVDCGSKYIQRLVEVLKTDNSSVVRIKIEELESRDFDEAHGIVISGSPTLLTQVDYSHLVKKTQLCVESKLPILGICFGHQLLGLYFGAEITLGELRKGDEEITLNESDLFKNIDRQVILQEMHREDITVPDNFVLIGTSNNTKNEAMKHKDQPIYGTQFHPEISGDVGSVIINNFIKISEKQ